MNTQGTFWRYTFLAAGSIFLTAIAAGQPASDPVERSMRFVDQSLKATELFNADKADQALPIFQDLLKQDRDLDEDGHVALSIGDCLASLGRLDQARQAYQNAAKLHPDLKSRIDQRLLQLALKGEITEELIAKLRTAAKTKNETQYSVNVQLERALIKKAGTLLVEAGDALQAAIKAGGPFGEGSRLLNRPAVLDEMIADLKNYTDFMDIGLGKSPARVFKELSEPEVIVLIQQCRWVTVRPGKPAMKFEMTTDKTGKLQTTANGKTLHLTPAQQSLVQRHQQRINAILLEAAEKPNAKIKK
jgi:tetratricopeptide (TPR) repeat protein